MSNPTPAITFSVNLTPFVSEQVGPNTNARITGMCSPDRFRSDLNSASVQNRKNERSTLLPTLNVCPDVTLKHGNTFTEYGQKAVYLRDTYGIGYAPADRAYLTVVSIA